MTGMRSGALFLTLAALAALGNCHAAADTWWYTYEADPNEGFPEECGWQRIMQGGGAERYFEDGSLVIDSLASTSICDSYYQYMPSLPDAQHPFRMEWRMLPATVIGDDPGVALSFAPYGYVTLTYEANRVYSWFEGIYVAEFVPGVFHDYALTSSDMLTYCLYVDGVPVHTGEVVGPSASSWAQWGDLVTGSASISVWDYARFGVVPEPTGVLLFGLAGLAASVRRTRHVWRTRRETS